MPQWNLTCAVVVPQWNLTCAGVVPQWNLTCAVVVPQWNLTCNYQPLVELPNTLYFSGVLLGSVVFGVISDRSVT